MLELFDGNLDGDLLGDFHGLVDEDLKGNLDGDLLGSSASTG
jgi:hypothetical protein